MKRCLVHPHPLRSAPHTQMPTACIGLLSDTHGVFDPAAAALLKGVELILHAGDVGHHGGHAEVLKAFAEATTSPILAVSGNVDDTPSASQLLPPHRVVDVAGWRLLLVHIVASAATSKVDPAAAALIKQHQPHLVVFGHSHKAAHWQADGVHFINPGSAGPARFKLKRTVAKLWLPPRPTSSQEGSGNSCVHTLQIISTGATTEPWSACQDEPTSQQSPSTAQEPQPEDILAVHSTPSHAAAAAAPASTPLQDEAQMQPAARVRRRRRAVAEASAAADVRGSSQLQAGSLDQQQQGAVGQRVGAAPASSSEDHPVAVLQLFELPAKAPPRLRVRKG